MRYSNARSSTKPALPALPPVAAEAGAGADGVVLAADRDRAAVDLAHAHHVGRGLETGEDAILVVALPASLPTSRKLFGSMTALDAARGW
jgi:hypothetical protein